MIRNKTKTPPLITLTHNSFGRPIQSNQARHRNKRQIGKEEVKLSLFACEIILYIENFKYFTKKLLEIINKYNKVLGTKSISKIGCISISNNELAE